MRSLWIGGIAASLSNLAFIWQAHVGAEPYALTLTISADNLSGGLATSAFIAYMGSLVNLRFTATQFALLSSLSAVGRTFLTVPAGIAAEMLGWDYFFLLSTFIGIPALILLWWLGKKPIDNS
jgi:PAT family beta-lactamase induction signal transducer AmpG